MPSIKSRKTSNGTLPYAASKPNSTTKTPKTKNPKGNVTPNAAAAVVVVAAAAAKEELASKAQRKLLRALLKSEFVASEDALPLSALGDLSNPILSVFKAANFPNVKDYAVIEPSVRLASHLLKHPSLRPMLRTILKHGDLIPVGEKESHRKPLYQYPDDSADEMADDDVALIDASLDELAGFVTFRAKLKQSAGNAVTVPLTKRHPKRDHRTPTLPGHRSNVEYSLAQLRLLTKASKGPVAKRDIPLLLVWRFTLAVSLAHEVCHALVLAKDGHSRQFDTEPFFHGALTAEVGFAMEEKLFGGSPSLLWADEQPNAAGATQVYYKSKGKLSDLVGVYVLWPWPCTSIVRDYQAHNCGLYMRKADMEALASKQVAWRIPLENLARFFETVFWSRDDPTTVFDRSVGFGISCDDVGERTAAEVSKEELGQYATSAFKISRHKAIIKK